MDNTSTQLHGQTDNSDTPDIGGRTIADICKASGLEPESVRQAWNRAKKKGGDLRPFSRTLTPARSEMSAVSCLADLGGKAEIEATPEVMPVAKKKAPATKTAATVAIATGVEKAVKAAKEWSIKSILRAFGFAILLLATMLVSWQNMYAVAGELFQENERASLALTGLLCFSPFIFSISGMAHGHIKVLVIGLGAFEWFCNVARIFGGLTGFSNIHKILYTAKDGTAHTVATVTGCPTRFLGLVCDLFGSGTAHTARVLAALLSGLIFWLFYAALFGLKK